MKGIELLERLQELFERQPELKNATIAIPITDEEKRKERSSGYLGTRTGLPYEKIRAVSDGAGNEGKFLILWPENELTHEPKKSSTEKLVN